MAGEAPDARALISAAAAIVIEAALRVLQGDPHQWSTRPCETCRTISSLAGKPFGCDLYRLQEAKR